MTIRSSVDGSVKMRQEWLKQGRLAKHLVTMLPKKIQTLEGSADVDYTGQLKLMVFGGQDSLHVVAEHGGTFGAAKVSPINGKWYREGVLGNTRITVHEVDGPPTCQVVAKRVEIVQYESECKED